MTATGRATGAELYPRALIAWLPYDYGFAMRRFLRRFQPRIAILAETELWPNLLRECVRAQVPVLLANARLSKKSARGYRRLGAFAREVIGGVTAIGAQTYDDGARLAALGARNITVTGNLKFDVTPPANADALAAELRATFGSRPVFLAASTRDGEEALILDALARQPLDDALTVIVPRHPQRFDEVANLVHARDHKLIRRSMNVPVPADGRFFLGDSLGEMAGYYRACDVAFIGGSLLAFGAQNLIEACDAGAPVLIGPSSFNFAQAAELAIAGGAALRVRDAHHLVSEAARLLAAPQERAQIAARGKAFCAEHRGAAERTFELCEPLLRASRARAAIRSQAMR
jgi:3-deoxy-D-manno-octulosonic-acid transferase